jgi:hypothetical protein
LTKKGCFARWNSSISRTLSSPMMSVKWRVKYGSDSATFFSSRISTVPPWRKSVLALPISRRRGCSSFWHR